MTIGFVGFGKMAEALWHGFRDENPIAVCFEPSPERQTVASALDVEVVGSIKDLMNRVSTVILCIKPQSLPEIATSVAPLKPDQELVSILAGIPIQRLESIFGLQGAIVRVMPNTPCMVGAGMSALAFAYGVPEKTRTRLLSLFKLTGDAIEVPEAWMNAVTGISGSGPAFLYRLVESAVAAGKQYDIPEEVAIRLFANTLIGAGTMMLKRDKTPAELVAEVTSPNGTTMAGLAEFDARKIDRLFSSVILKAILRSEELSQ